MSSIPNNVKWPCYENGAPVRFGEVIDNGAGHFPVKSIRFTENGWIIYDSAVMANARFAETGRYDEHATRYVEPDSWIKWHKDTLTLINDDVCAYFGNGNSLCGDCPARNACDCDEVAVSDLKQRAIKLAKEEK